jgi:hypothetical protein
MSALKNEVAIQAAKFGTITYLKQDYNLRKSIQFLKGLGWKYLFSVLI